MNLLKSLSFLLFTLFPLAACAELPPAVYQDLQKRAGEAIEIQIDTRNSKRTSFFDFSGKRKERLEATVTKVTRSKSGLKVGDKITLIYKHTPLPRDAVGPSPTPKLTKGKKYPAWLNKSPGGHFIPAARGFSFRKIK